MASSRWSDVWLRCLSAVTFLVLWQAAAGAAASPLLPGPAAVAAALAKLALHGRLLADLGITLLRVVASFALAMAAGSAIGILMGHSRRVDGLFDLWLVLGLNIPALVLIFLCYLWLGLTEVAAIVAVALNKVPNSSRHGISVPRLRLRSWSRSQRRRSVPPICRSCASACSNSAP